MTNLTVYCLSIIGPDDSLLYIKKYTSNTNSNEDFDLELDATIYSARKLMPQKNTYGKKYGFLGLVNHNQIEHINCYGYKASFGYKIIVLLPNNQIQQKESSTIQTLCEKIKDELFRSFMNPFYTPFSPISSPILKEKIDKLVKNLHIE